MFASSMDDDHGPKFGKQVFVGQAARPIRSPLCLSRINSAALLWDLPDHDVVVKAWPRVVRDVWASWVVGPVRNPAWDHAVRRCQPEAYVPPTPVGFSFSFLFDPLPRLSPWPLTGSSCGRMSAGFHKSPYVMRRIRFSPPCLRRRAHIQRGPYSPTT